MGATQSEPGTPMQTTSIRQSVDSVIDTSHLSDAKKEIMIISKRGAFQWLPVVYDLERGPINDLEVGSWYDNNSFLVSHIL